MKVERVLSNYEDVDSVFMCSEYGIWEAQIGKTMCDIHDIGPTYSVTFLNDDEGNPANRASISGCCENFVETTLQRVRIAARPELKVVQAAPRRSLDPFGSSRYSIARAKKHVNEMRQVQAEFFRTNPYEECVERDDATGDRLVKVKLTKAIPEELGGLIFDAATNLRSALDQAVFSITKNEFGAFPIARSETDLPKQLNGRCSGMPDELKNIIKSVRPFKGGNNMLFALNRLANTNKHADVTHPATTLSAFSAKVHILEGRAMPIEPKWDSERNEMTLYRIGNNTRFQVELSIGMYLSIGGVEFIEGKPILQTMDQLVNLVSGILKRLSQECDRLNLF